MTRIENEIVIFNAKDVDVCLVIDPEQETVWATHQQIADVFGIDRTGATRHINNIFKSGEVEEESNVQKMHIAKSDRPVKYYNLDVILSVGYRANSAKAIEFRRWANTVLKKYIVSCECGKEFDALADWQRYSGKTGARGMGHRSFVERPQRGISRYERVFVSKLEVHEEIR
jgi:hypothetical protein